MSDIGLDLSFWFEAGPALIVALPVTKAVVGGVGIAVYRIRRRDRARRLTTLKWIATCLAPFWLGGLVLGAWALVGIIRTQIDQAQRYFALPGAAEIDGVARRHARRARREPCA